MFGEECQLKAAKSSDWLAGIRLGVCGSIGSIILFVIRLAGGYTTLALHCLHCRLHHLATSLPENTALIDEYIRQDILYSSGWLLVILISYQLKL